MQQQSCKNCYCSTLLPQNKMYKNINFLYNNISNPQSLRNASVMNKKDTYVILRDDSVRACGFGSTQEKLTRYHLFVDICHHLNQTSLNIRVGFCHQSELGFLCRYYLIRSCIISQWISGKQDFILYIKKRNKDIDIWNSNLSFNLLAYICRFINPLIYIRISLLNKTRYLD